MLEIEKDLTINISYGDILDVTFNITGLTINQDAEFYLSIKKSLHDEDCAYIKQLSFIDFEKNSVRIVIESADMERFTVGKYYYDLVYKVEGNRRTLNYPARLVVREVVHDEWS